MRLARSAVGMIDAGRGDALTRVPSGVYFAVSDGFGVKPESVVYSFCHALPERWHLMPVRRAPPLSDWAAKLTGQRTS